MGTVIGTVEDVGKRENKEDPVVYQLVRVEGDGRLVPATDDEVIKVGQLLEDDKSKQQPVECTRHDEGCLFNGHISSKKSDFEVNDNLNISKASIDDLQSETRDTAPSSVLVNDSQNAQAGSAEICTKPTNEAVTSRSSVSETCTSSKPNFSILKGEICLDNLSIRELQEVFRATFGRETSVKDKLWLKRRIAMGLTNSCDVPSTSFVIRNDKIVYKEVKEEAPCPSGRSKSEVVSLSMDQITDLTNASSQELQTSPTSQIVHQQSSGKRPKEPPLEHDVKEDDCQMGQFAAKRIRKPTRRYIEELSELETRESPTKVHSSVKGSEQDQSSTKYQSRYLRFGNQSKRFSIRYDSVGGFGMLVPYLSRVRRGRPRKNFMAIMKYHPSSMSSNLIETVLSPLLPQETKSESRVRKARSLPVCIVQPSLFNKERVKMDMQTFCREELDLDNKIAEAWEDSTDDNTDSQPLVQAGERRKHHRAWTLCEVLKLVEGVARYGAGRWSEIRRLAFASYSYRTSVDLKDKWRNLLRASLAQGPDENGARNFRKQTSVPIPPPILSRVRELAELHAQTGIEIKPNKSRSHGGKAAQGKGSGFL